MKDNPNEAGLSCQLDNQLTDKRNSGLDNQVNQRQQKGKNEAIALAFQLNGNQELEAKTYVEAFLEDVQTITKEANICQYVYKTIT